MSFRVTFFVPGQPIGKARPRITRAGHAYTPKKTVDYERSIAWQARAAMRGMLAVPFPVAIHVRMHFGVPQSWGRADKAAALTGILLPTTKPDADNVLKAVKDALNQIVYVDDCQVVEGTFSKRYAELPGVDVTVESIG
jgi:Holliday junction resolvase RusA-like endonuclease